MDVSGVLYSTVFNNFLDARYKLAFRPVVAIDY